QHDPDRRVLVLERDVLAQVVQVEVQSELGRFASGRSVHGPLLPARRRRSKPQSTSCGPSESRPPTAPQSPAPAPAAMSPSTSVSKPDHGRSSLTDRPYHTPDPPNRRRSPPVVTRSCSPTSSAPTPNTSASEPGCRICFAAPIACPPAP